MKRIAKIISGVMFFVSCVFSLNAQDIRTEVYTREHIPNKKPIPFPYIREADVMWAKDIYRIIDLRQRQNLMLYYPLKPIGDRMSLVDLLLYAVDHEGVRAFSTDDPKNEFTIPLTKDKIDQVFGAGFDTVKVPDINTGTLVTKVVERPRRTEQIKQILLKEKWYFDKNHSVLRVQIIGICPIRVYDMLDDQGNPTGVVRRQQTFWIYYPEVRPILASHEVFNPNNDAQRISFDDYFMQRRFSSYIVAESNVYENRWINSYAMGMDAMLESERIKESIFNFEHDLWEY